MTNEMATGLVFLAYMVGVFGLAICSNRLLQKKSFLAEYFLGSRGLGTWALAFTFAATSASGGSFTGYPSLVYTHGWILAFWIASYMIVPIVTMGLMGKRLNQVGRRAGAITIPDVLRERFSSTGLALFAAATIIFFTITNLVAQFKAGGVILDVLLQGTPGYRTAVVPLFAWIPDSIPLFSTTPPGYICGLLIFSVTVVVYTSYGGFRAVVWTDVMQGVVMGIGVLLLIPCTLYYAGGLEKVTRELNERPPRLVMGLKKDKNVLEYHAKPEQTDLYVHHRKIEGSTEPVTHVQRLEKDGKTVVEVGLGADDQGAVTATALQVKEAIEAAVEVAPIVEVRIPTVHRDESPEADNDGSGTVFETSGPLHVTPGSDLVFGPGRKADGMPFHPFAMGISFFFMWAISGAGQPGTMVRLMAFDDSRTLRRAIFTVTIYFGIIYLPMVLIFVAAQTIIHPSELSNGPDQIMPALAKLVAHPLLAGILIAAPFAAVMSTVDSFLLMISSSLVRDFYQRTINPDISEKTIKYASYGTTAVIGTLVTILALNPPQFLQYIIVFTGGGFAATFLAPVFLGLYWKGITKAGALSSMVGGFATVVGLFSVGHVLAFFNVVESGSRIDPFGFHPIVVGLTVSFGLGILVSLVTPKLPEATIRRFFARPEEAGDIAER